MCIRDRPRPLVVTILGPIGFWAPMVQAFAPILTTREGLPKMWEVAAWSFLLGTSMAVVENLLLPSARRRLTWLVLGGTLACLAVLRVVGFIPLALLPVALMSGLILMVPVSLAYASLVAVPVLILVPPLRRFLQFRLEPRI